MEEVIFSPAEFVAVLNQTLEFAYPAVAIEGELADFKVSRSKWVYFDLVDDEARVSFFGNVYTLPGPLEDGMMLRVVALPRLHERFGFKLNIRTITPVGEGTIKKAAALLAAKLQKEGLFDPGRKRPLPLFPERIGLVTAEASAAYADFIKITGERWGGVEITVVDSLVQGDAAPAQIARAIELLNKLSILPEAIVITRGGGSAEDLSAFNDEKVVRAIAASRVPTLVAIGHEVDESLAELAADRRASTPTNAAQVLLPDRATEAQRLANHRKFLDHSAVVAYKEGLQSLARLRVDFRQAAEAILNKEKDRLAAKRALADSLDPKLALKRGYALVRAGGVLQKSVVGVKTGSDLQLELSDGKIDTEVKKVTKNG